jgi:hypothetical protein
MKKVFTNSELAHVYAQQSQDEGRNPNGSFYFRGKTLYSYGSHFPICKFVTNDKGENALLFTERTYSNTTAKQISLTRNATNQFNKVYCSNPDNTHADNFKAWTNEAERSADKLAKAKKPILYLNELGYISNKVNIYASFFGIEIPESLTKLLSIKDKSQYIEYAEKQSILLAEKMRVQKLAEKKKFKESFKKWQNFEIPYLYGRVDYDFLRLNNERIDTTQGVQIPVEIAKNLYNKIVDNTIKVGEKILNYEVASVGNEIKIGCHTFKKSYLLQFGAKLI